MTTTAPAPPTPGASLLDDYRRVRRQTERLAAPLEVEDQVVQSMPDASPVKWHRAHTSWFFETFLLKPLVPGYVTIDDRYAYLFNSYYNAVGAQFSRPHRGMVTRPTVADVTAYRQYVDEHMLRLLGGDGPAAGPVDEAVVRLGLNHEQQHQELMLTDLKHMLAQNPLFPVYQAAATPAAPAPPATMGWIAVEEGVYEVGYSGSAFCYDNETPRHKTFLQAFALGTRLVTAGEYLEFMRDGGYTTHDLWLSDGWARVNDEGWRAPLYWIERDGAWQHFTLGGLRPIDPAEPVTHVSHYEADAYARWAGARLPTEFEWEVAAATAPVTGTFVESARCHPAPAGAGEGLLQLYGDAWQWTGSAYLPYPGFNPPDGAIGEYNAKFMSGQMVLRGGSVATPADHIRPTYRNFFPPWARWQFSGVRLAK